MQQEGGHALLGGVVTGQGQRQPQFAAGTFEQVLRQARVVSHQRLQLSLGDPADLRRHHGHGTGRVVGGAKAVQPDDIARQMEAAYALISILVHGIGFDATGAHDEHGVGGFTGGEQGFAGLRQRHVRQQRAAPTRQFVGRQAVDETISVSRA